MEREELINRIVEEKGEEAVPALLDLLLREDDETAQICSQAIVQLGGAAVPELLKRLKDKDRDPISTLYLVDLAGELGDRRLVPQLYNLLREYGDEKEQTVIYEALAKLGEGTKVAGVLALLLEESGDGELTDQLIMALSQTGSIEGVKALAKLYGDKKLDKSTKAFVLEGLHLLLSTRAELKSVLLSLDNGKEIMERLYVWQKEI